MCVCRCDGGGRREAEDDDDETVNNKAEKRGINQASCTSAFVPCHASSVFVILDLFSNARRSLWRRQAWQADEWAWRLADASSCRAPNKATSCELMLPKGPCKYHGPKASSRGATFIMPYPEETERCSAPLGRVLQDVGGREVFSTTVAGRLEVRENS